MFEHLTTEKVKKKTNQLKFNVIEIGLATAYQTNLHIHNNL